jgi:hypothetical protein
MGTQDAPGTIVGARLADRLADVVTRATVDVRGRLASQSRDIAVKAFTEATNHVSDEVRAVAGDLFAGLADAPDVDPAIKPLLHHLGHTRGQAYGWIGGAAMGAAMGAGLMDLISNWLSEPIGALIAQNPRSTLSPEQSAAINARNLPVAIDLEHEAARKGVNSDRLAALTALHQSAPPLEMLLAMLNRGHISEAEAIAALADLAIRPGYWDTILRMAHSHLTPELSASAWARNLLTPEQVYQTAAKAGIGRVDADTLMGLAGEPPPLESLITAWRRGIITESDVDRGIVQGPIRNEWIPAVKALQEQPLPAEVAASAVTQGHLSVDQGAAKAALSGYSAQDFAVIVETSGLPPGIEWAAEAFNRGIITDEQYTAMFLESRIKNKYVPFMKAMRTRLISAETVRMMYRNGVYPADAAVQTLLGHGYTEVDARAMLALEDVRRTEGTRELTRAQVLQLFDNDIIDLSIAQGLLTDLGFGSDEIEWMLALTEVSKTSRFVSALMTRVRNGFLAGNVSEDEAAQLMSDAGVGGTAISSAIQLWTLEREALAANLTTSQIQQAIKRNLLTEAEAIDRFKKRGYTDRDAQVLVTLARPA